MCALEIEELINSEAAAVREQPWWKAARETDKREIRDVVDSCSLSVTVADPQDPDFPVIGISEGFEAMTQYSKRDILGKNNRFLNCSPVNSEDMMQFQLACQTGQPFTGLLAGERKNGQLFMSLLVLRGLHVGFAEDGQDVWYLIGIQADVTALAEDDLSAEQLGALREHLRALREVAARIRERLTQELGQFALAASDGFRRQTSGESTESSGSMDSAGSFQRTVTPLAEPRWVSQAGSALPHKGANDILSLGAPTAACVASQPARHCALATILRCPSPGRPLDKKMVACLGLSCLAALSILAGLSIGRRSRK